MSRSIKPLLKLTSIVSALLVLPAAGNVAVALLLWALS